MTKDDFLEWKSDPRTKEVMKAVEAACFNIAQELARKAGLDDKQDRYEAGVIRGMERILEIDYEEGDISE